MERSRSPTPTGGKRAVYDSETNGYLYETNRIHCICIKDFDSLECFSYHTDNGSYDIRRGIDHLNSFRLAIGHNICGFDIPVVYKLYGEWPEFSPRDTYVMSKMFYPEQPLHSLEHYGKFFNRHKPTQEDWTRFTPEMLHRCSEDVEINFLLYQRFILKHLSKWNWIPSVKLEQDFQIYQTMQEMVGLDIDTDLAERLIVEMDEEVKQIDAILSERLPLRVVSKGEVKKPFKMDGSYSKMNLDWWSLCS